MLTVNKLIPQARGLAPVLTRRAARVEIDWDVRQRSRFDATDTAGRQLGVFLPRGTVVRGGDVLVADDGSLIVVQAAAQPVLVATPCPDHGSPLDLLRAAYHLGNRHVALELRPDRLQLEPDHVLADLLRQMHLIVHEANTAFEPESGAYAAVGDAHAGHAHASAPPSATVDDHEPHGREPHVHEPQRHEHHDHGHHDQAGHDHAPPRAVASTSAPAAHVHRPGCRHDHGG